MKTFEELKAELLQHPEVRAEYDRLQEGFAMIDQATINAATAVLTCAPLDCPRERNCFLLARFVMARVREIESARAAPPDDDPYSVGGRCDGGWEAA